MNMFAETKKNYFIVMLFGLAALSCLYWLFFYFNFSSLLIYILALIFYITVSRVWLKLFEKKGHLLFFPVERFVIINLIILSFVLTVNSCNTVNLLLITDLTCVYGVMFFLFLFWYAFRIKKQEKVSMAAIEFSITSKILTAMCAVFLLSDLAVSLLGKLTMQFVLQLPILFLILSFVISVCIKSFKLKSFVSLFLFFNVYVISTFLLVLNGVNYNFFPFIVIAHFIAFSSTAFMIRVNSVENEDFESLYGLENMALVFFNIVLIFISLNNFLYANMPGMFINYLYFISIILIGYLGWKNYKMI